MSHMTISENVIIYDFPVNIRIFTLTEKFPGYPYTRILSLYNTVEHEK